MHKTHIMSHRKINIPVEAELVVLSQSSWDPLAVTGEADIENYLAQRFARAVYEARKLGTVPPSVRDKRLILKKDAIRKAQGGDFPCQPARPLTPDHVVDAWSVRTQFLSWSPGDWRTFADTVGVPDIHLLSEEDFANWQELLKEAMVSPPSQWPSLSSKFGNLNVQRLFEPLPVRFRGIPFPAIKVSAAEPLRAMISTIQLDALSGSQFRYCARNDCTAPPFELESRHERIYCSPECAHLVAVRNSRAKVKKPKNAKRRKPKES